MKLIYGNLFHPDSYKNPDGTPAGLKPSALVITTNGFVKTSGAAVMGRGCAKAAADFNPRLPLALGNAIKSAGNIVQQIGVLSDLYRIVAFPVKPVSALCLPDKSNVVKHMQSRMTPGKMVPGWACIADIKLIEYSANRLRDLAYEKDWIDIVLPRPGCGYGELSWSNVFPVLNSILDDSFYSITY